MQLNSSPKTKARENSRMLVKTMVFLLDQSAIGVIDLNIRHKNVLHSLNPLANAKPFVSAFTTTVKSTRGDVEVVDEEEELMESKFEKMDDQHEIYTTYTKLYKVSEKHEKLYRLTTRKLSEVEL